MAAAFQPFFGQRLTLISGNSLPQWKLIHLLHVCPERSCIIYCLTLSALGFSWSPTFTDFAICTLHEWFSGGILACHVGDWGLIPRSCILILAGCLRRVQFRFEERTLARRGRLSSSCQVKCNQSASLLPPNSAIRWHVRLISTRQNFPPGSSSGLLHTKP